jgi:hypothetical protein
MESNIILYAVSFAILVLGGAGIWWYFTVKMYQIDNPVETEGEIVEIMPIETSTVGLNSLFSGKDKVLFHPIVRFRIDSVKLVRFRNRKGFKSADNLLVGKTVKIAYSKHNPLVAKILD